MCPGAALALETGQRKGCPQRRNVWVLEMYVGASDHEKAAGVGRGVFPAVAAPIGPQAGGRWVTAVTGSGVELPRRGVGCRAKQGLRTWEGLRPPRWPVWSKGSAHGWVFITGLCGPFQS